VGGSHTKYIKKVDVYVTGNLSLTDKESVLHASRRSKIDEFYQDAKDNLGFNQYQVRSLREIKRYWYLVFLAYTYLKIGNLKGAFQRVFKPSVTLDTLGDLLSTFKKMSFIYLWRQLKNHYNVLFRAFFYPKFSSIVFKKLGSYPFGGPADSRITSSVGSIILLFRAPFFSMLLMSKFIASAPIS